LVNGEQIIGNQESTSGGVHIHHPFYVMEIQDKHSIILINVCTFTDQQYIVVQDKHIVFSIPASESMTRYYEAFVASSKNTDTTKMINAAIKDIENMEENMQELISKRLVGGSTIN
jgi:hypothetical protein